MGRPVWPFRRPTTDAEGRFTLDDIDPGSYFLLAQRVGYLDQGYGAADPAGRRAAASIELPARPLRDVTSKLTPQSLLYGKVVDEDGDAIPNAQVQVLRASYAGGRRHLVEAGRGRLTGRRQLRRRQSRSRPLLPERRPSGHIDSRSTRPASRAREIRHHVFPERTPDPSAAAPVEVNPGAEVRGLAIRLRKSARLPYSRPGHERRDRQARRAVFLRLGERTRFRRF